MASILWSFICGHSSYSPLGGTELLLAYFTGPVNVNVNVFVLVLVHRHDIMVVLVM